MIPEDYNERIELFEHYAQGKERFHAAGIRKAMERDLGALRKSHAILLEKDLARWLRGNKAIEFIEVCGRTHHYTFREPNQ